MSVAERDLRRLQQELQDALAKGAPDAEIDRLMQELQRGARPLSAGARARSMRTQPGRGEQPVDPSKVLTSRDLQRMLDRARDLARSGARDQARELLSQLQNMLENLRTARPGQMQQQGASEAQQMMRGLQRDDAAPAATARPQLPRAAPGQQGQQGSRASSGQQPGQTGQHRAAGGRCRRGPTAQMGEAAGQQEGLRHMLGEMMRRLGDGMGDIPEPFGRAERAMRDAAGALQRRQPGEAIGPQTEALDQLQQAARDFAQQMQKRLGNGWGEPNGDEVGATDRSPRDRVERDPFGRPMSNERHLRSGRRQDPGREHPAKIAADPR